MLSRTRAACSYLFLDIPLVADMVTLHRRGPGLSALAASVQGLERVGPLYKVTDVTMPIVRESPDMYTIHSCSLHC